MRDLRFAALEKARLTIGTGARDDEMHFLSLAGVQ